MEHFYVEGWTGVKNVVDEVDDDVILVVEDFLNLSSNPILHDSPVDFSEIHLLVELWRELGLFEQLLVRGGRHHGGRNEE